MKNWLAYLLREMFVTNGGRMFRGKRLIDVPDAKALLLPKGWAKQYARDGWVVVDYHAKSRTWSIRPLSSPERKAVAKVRGKGRRRRS